MPTSYMLSALAAVVTLIAPVAYAEHGDPMPAPLARSLSTTECRLDIPATLGSRGAHVECLQAKLIEQKFLTAIDVPTGYFGQHTKAAVIAWQAAQGLPQTGFFGELSRARFGAPVQASTMMMAHAHEPVAVDAWPAIPKITIEALPDALSGFNVHISVQNFAFAPERVNTAVVAGEGHAHIYIDGVKIGRVYGPWVHLPKDAFKTAGVHMIAATLNANDHSELSAGGMHIQATTTVTIK